MKILVTGASGQLGLSIRDAAQCSGHDLIFTDLVPSGHVSGLDITDASAVAERLASDDVSVIVNCASYTDVNKAESEPELAFKVNAEAAGILADAAAAAGALLIHISTDYVFDGSLSRPYSETDQPAPVNAYGRSKLAGERAIEASGCRYLIFRTSWLYSNYGRNFYRTMIELTAGKPVLKVVSDQIGTPTWAADLAETIVDVIDVVSEYDSETFPSGIYHYSSEGVCSWYDFAKEICAGAGHLCDVLPCRSEEYPTSALRPAFSVLDKTRFKETFGLEIPHWRESLLVCLDLREE